MRSSTPCHTPPSPDLTPRGRAPPLCRLTAALKVERAEVVAAPGLGAIPKSARGGRALSERRPPPGVSIACPIDKANRGNAAMRVPPLGADGERPPQAPPPPGAGLDQSAEQPADLYELEAKARRASHSHRNDAEPESVSISLASVNMQSLRDHVKCADMFRELLHSPTLNGDSEMNED